jgi:hypothetical protein
MPLTLKRQARFAPRRPRAGIRLGTSFVLPDDRVVPVVIENLSAEGFMAKCRGRVSADVWLGVELPGCGIVRALVRWSEAGEVGCRFRRPIDLDRLAPAEPTQPGGLFSSPGA